MTAANDTNGKQVAINTLTDQMDKVFERVHDIETKGCVPGRFTAKEVTEVKKDMTSIKKLLWIIIVILAATQGPQVIAWITKVM